MFCREWLAQLEQHHAELAAAGLNVAAVGLGEPKHARHFCPRLAPSLTCLVGQGAEAHLAYGLRRGGAAEFVGPGTLMAGARAVLGGYLQGTATGPQDILGATFVVDGQGLIRAAYYDRFAGDHPDLKALLASYSE